MILTGEQLQVQRTAREFATREIAPHAQAWESTGTPVQVMRALGELGFMGMCIDPEWGGAGADWMSYVLEIGRAHV